MEGCDRIMTVFNIQVYPGIHSPNLPYVVQGRNPDGYPFFGAGAQGADQSPKMMAE